MIDAGQAICEVIDEYFFEDEIDIILKEAALLIPAMKRKKQKAPMFYQNMRILMPSICCDPFRGTIVAELFNYFAYEDGKEVNNK